MSSEIKKEGNRDFEGHYYHPRSRKFHIGKFLKMCKEELKDFEALKLFLKKCSTRLRKMRNLKAHRGPRKLSFSKDYKKILIPRVGKPDYEFDYQELCDFFISYGNFINKIGLHANNRYDSSEDTIGILHF